MFNAATGALSFALTKPTPAYFDRFGYSVAVSGNALVVGVPYDDAGTGYSGVAYLFNATTGALVATLWP